MVNRWSHLYACNNSKFQTMSVCSESLSYIYVYIRIRDLHVLYKFLLVLYATLYYCTYSYVGMHACAQDTGERISSSSKMHRRFLMLSWQTPLGRCGRREGEILICS